MMTNEILTEVACPNCLNPIDVRQHGRHITCDACSSRFILRGHLCPNCSSYNQEEASLCGQCGTALTRICRKCSTSNWAGDEYCRQCSNAMDILDLIAGNYHMQTSERLLDQRQKARGLQAEEERASKRRMQELMDIEQARQEELYRRLQIQRKQERTTIILMALGIGFFVVVLIMYGLLKIL
jgi:DNA-directed RNA polymerase subunit RPC12/RpoP